MWCRAVKFGGDSGAVQQVSDIGGGFGRVTFTARSRRCHGIDVKREIISAALRQGQSGGCASGVRGYGERAMAARRMRPLAASAREFPVIGGTDSSSLDRTASEPPRASLLFAALARDFERAVEPFCARLRICSREDPCASAAAEHAITRWRTTMTLRARSFIAAVALLAFTLVGSSAFGQTRTLYDRLGGYGAISAVVDDFVKNVAADKRI